jgi:hypothetical protein
MSDFRFPPGPWSVGSERSMRQQITLGGVSIMAHCALYDTKAAIFQIRHNPAFGDIETTLAIARLVAAAPDAIDALLMGPSTEHPPLPGADGVVKECRCSQCEFVRASKAVIAKVRGNV